MITRLLFSLKPTTMAAEDSLLPLARLSQMACTGRGKMVMPLTLGREDLMLFAFLPGLNYEA